MNHQDWEPVILRKPVKVVNKPNVNKKKVNDINDDSEFNISKITKELKLKILQGRALKKWSQKELAKQLNVPVQTIINYENGKAMPNNQFISKIEAKLGVKLPRIKNKK